jgi:hypothetical protein
VRTTRSLPRRQWPTTFPSLPAIPMTSQESVSSPSSCLRLFPSSCDGQPADEAHRRSIGGDPSVAELPVDVDGEGLGRDAAQPADADGLDLSVGEQVVEQASSDVEPLSCLRHGEEHRHAVLSSTQIYRAKMGLGGPRPVTRARCRRREPGAAAIMRGCEHP